MKQVEKQSFDLKMGFVFRGSNKDFREFLRQMRVHAEKEQKK